MSIKGSAVDFLSRVAASGPWRSTLEKVLVSLAHKYPTSRTVLSFCRHFGSKLAVREGPGFSRLAVFETDGVMFCEEKNLGYYFCGTITGLHIDEQCIVQLMRRLVREGDVFFDLGANFGYYSCLLVPLCGKSGAVHAFEANPYLIPNLIRSAELNHKNGNIYVNAVAIGKDSETFLPLYDPEWIGCSSLYPHDWLNRVSKVLVPVTTVDKYVQEKCIKRIDVMKIDIEGAELDALLGMKDTFCVCPPKVIICELTLLPEENDPLRHSPGVLRRASSAADPRRLVDFLKRKGYGLWAIGEDGRFSTWTEGKLTAAEPLKLANAAFVLPELQRLRPEIFAAR